MSIRLRANDKGNLKAGFKITKKSKKTTTMEMLLLLINEIFR